MLRIAAVIDAAGISGPARQLGAIATALRARDVELTVVGFHRVGRPEPAFMRLLDDLGVPRRVLIERWVGDLRLVGQLRRTIDAIGAQIIQTHGYKPTALAYLLRKSGCGLPWLAFFHGATAENLKIRAYQWLDRQLMKDADHIAVMSMAQADAYRDLGPPVTVVHNAVIPLVEERVGGEVPPPSSVTDSAPESPRLSVIGRLSPEKGVDVFLDACALLRDRNVGFRAEIVGDGPEKTALIEQSRRLRLEDRVSFVGHQTDMRAVYPRTDLLVLPSRSEGLPNVLLEGLRADRPVVATAVGAVPEVLALPEAGIMVPPGDPAALALGIERGLSTRGDPGPRAARRQTANRFSLEHRAKVHLALYRDLVPGNAERPSGFDD